MLIEIAGIHLYYKQCGTGEPLLLLHGNGETHQIFDELIIELSKKYTVYAIDSPGHGQSSPVSDIGYEKMADIIRHFIVKMAFQKPILYGFSDGGIIGLLIAIKHPGLLAKLAVSGVNTVPGGLKKNILNRISTKYQQTKSSLLYMMLTEPNIPDHDLKNIQIPVLLTAGENDMIARSHTRHIAKQIPDSTLTILSGEDHGSYIVNSTKLLPVLIPFLSRMEIQFRKSEYRDLNSIMRIVSTAQATLKQLQIDQWQDGYPNHSVITNDINKGISYVLTKGNEVIATAAISFDREPTYKEIYEGEWLTPSEPYAVIHRIAVSDSCRKTGLASRLIQYVEQMCHSKSISHIKMDTHKDNLPMQNMLKKNHFRYCGIIYLEDKNPRLAYEKVITR